MLYLHVLFYNFGLFQLQLIRVIWFSYLVIALSVLLQQMAPTKQAKVIKEFQKQSAQMDMTVQLFLSWNTFTFRFCSASRAVIPSNHT